MTTTDKNKLIAEFMEVYNSDSGWNYSLIGNKGVQYHSSYDWIMPVVERIAEMGYYVDIFIKAVSIHKDEMIVDLDGNNYPTKLSTIYNAVVEFIMWYNLNKEEK